MTAFGKVVDYGLKSEKLSVKFLFKPGSTQFSTDRKTRAPYDAWLDKIAERTGANQGCLEVVGHTSATGLAQINDRLSGLRADYIKDRLEEEERSLARQDRFHRKGISRDAGRDRQGRCQRRARPPGGIQNHQMRIQRTAGLSSD